MAVGDEARVTTGSAVIVVTGSTVESKEVHAVSSNDSTSIPKLEVLKRDIFPPTAPGPAIEKKDARGGGILTRVLFSGDWFFVVERSGHGYQT